MYINTLFDLIQYIAGKTIDLKNKYIEEKDLKIDYLTVFSHSESEFLEMQNAAIKLGAVIDQNNGPIHRLYKPINIPTGQLGFFRIRHPDRERPQKGCDDFRTGDFEEFKKKYLHKFKNNLTLIKRPEYEMIEIKDSDFDVLVYFPSILFSKVLHDRSKFE